MSRQSRKATVVPATPDHGIRLAPDILERDAQDMINGWGKTPREGILESIESSNGECWAIIVDDDDSVAGIFGVAGDGNIWIVTGKTFSAIALRFVRQSQEYIDRLLGKYKRLYGYVNSGNVKMIRWLRWSGFEIINLNNGYARCEKCAYPQ